MQELTGDPTDDLRYIIVDLDGTLSDCSAREVHAQNREWDRFHQESENDPVHMDVVHLIAMMSTEYRILILTGRPEKYRGLTVEWLNKNSLSPYIEDILMRPDHDWSSDAEIKPHMLAEYFENENGNKVPGIDQALDSVSFILEDRDKMVERWRNLGFCCWQVRQGAY